MASKLNHFDSAEPDAYELLRVLHTLLEVVSDPARGCPPGSGKTPTFARSATLKGERVSLYVEYIYAEDQELLGWRIFIVGCDPEFKLDVGLQACLSSGDFDFGQRKKKHKGASTREDMEAEMNEEHQRITSYHTKREWIEDGLPAFTNDTLDEREEGVATSQKKLDWLYYELQDERNPLRASRIFTLERSNLAFPRALPAYKDVSAYTTRATPPPAAAAAEAEAAPAPQPTMAEKLLKTIKANKDAAAAANPAAQATPVAALSDRIHFPNGAYHVPIELRTPARFFEIPLRPEPRAEDLAADSTKRLRAFLNETSGGGFDENLATDLARKGWAELTRGKPPSEIASIRNSRQAREMFTSTCMQYHKNPGSQIATGWLFEKMKQEPDWAPCANQDPIFNTELSPFGNFVAMELYRLESFFGIAVLHADMLLMLLVTLQMTDIESEGMMFHFTAAGPPGSGKSHIQKEVMEKCTIPGMVYNIGTQTKKANATHSNYNGYIIRQDELNETLSGRGQDGTGDPHEKSLLSEGISTDISCHVDDNGKKRQIKSQHRRKATMFANTNVTADKLAEAVKDRMYVHSVPVQTVKGFSADNEEQIRATNPELKEYLEMSRKRWHFFQSVAAMIHVKVLCEQFPSLDTSLLSVSAARIFDALRDNFNTTLEGRDRQRIIRLAKTCMIFEAISEVWFSGNVVPPGTPFSLDQLNLLLPYLVGKREHLFFALSLMGSLIQDPALSAMLTEVRNVALEEPDIDARYGRVESLKEPDGGGFNHYAIYVAGLVQGDCEASILWRAAELLIRRIKVQNGIVLSPNQLKSILSKLLQQSKAMRPYINETTLSEGSELVVTRFLVIRRTITGYYVCFARQFVDALVLEKRDIVREAIRMAIDAEFPTKKLVLGSTWRHGYEMPNGESIVLPYVFQTMDTEAIKQAARPLRLPSLKFKRFAFKQMALGGKPGDALEFASRRETLVEGVLEKRQTKAWCESVGVEVPKEERVPALPFGPYPQVLAEQHMLAFGEPETAVSQSAACTGAAAGAAEASQELYE